MDSDAAASSRTIRVEVHLHGELGRLAPPGARGPVQLRLAESARVADVLERLAVPRTRSLIIGVGGETATEATELSDGARLDLLTPMAGGGGWLS